MADQQRQQRRFHHRGDADPDLGHAEHRALAGDAQVAGSGEFEPGAERIAVDPGDNRHGEAAKPVAAAVDERDEIARAVLVKRRQLTDIGAADKRALAGAAKDHQAQRRIGFEKLDRLDNLDHQRAVEGVELCRIVDRQARDMPAFLPFLVGDDNTHRAFLRLELATALMHSRRGLRQEARVEIIEDIAEIRSIYGEPAERSVKKQLARLEKHSRAFIALSPFLVIASADPSGRVDASPKGDAPGFVQVIDDETLLIPDRLGNNRIETIRVNGRARITSDPALLEPCTVAGKVPRSGILITAEEVYFHCGKALIRSDLWNPEKHVAQSDFPSLGRIITEQIGEGPVEAAERYTAE